MTKLFVHWPRFCEAWIHRAFRNSPQASSYSSHIFVTSAASRSWGSQAGMPAARKIYTCSLATESNLKLERVYIRCCRVLVVSSPCTYLLDHFLFNLRVTDSLHHGKMFKVVVSLEERVACEEFDQNTSNAPDVTGKAPSQLQYDFRGSIMSC